MKIKKIILGVLGVGLAIYGAFLIKKTFIDKGYASSQEERDILIAQYLILKGLPDTPSNREKYKSVSLEQIKKELGY